MLVKNGWTLSPAFDINPNESGRWLSLNINESDNSLDLKLAFEVAEYFRLNKRRAIKIVETTKKAVSNWRIYGKEIGITKEEQEKMSMAFIQ